MSVIPEPPVVPPAPSRLNPGTDFAEKADALAVFYPTLVAYIVAAIAWMVDAMQQIAATALAGTLPSLSGHALKLMRVNAAGTMAEFVASADVLNGTAAVVLNGTALSGVENAHGSQVMLGAGGAAPWNRAAGAVDYLNPLFWQNGVTTSGVTATIAGTGVTADKIPYVDYDLAGTMTGQFATFGYIQTASNTAGLNLQSWTGSVFMAVLGPAGGGAGAAQIGSGVRVLVESAGNTSGNLITGSTPTLSTATRVLVADGTVSLRTHILGASGTVINARVRVYGLQLELAAQRTNGQYRELLPSEVRTLLDMSGIGSAATLSGPFVDRSGIPAHANEVTVTLSGVTRTGAQMPLLQAMVAGAAVTAGYIATSGALYGTTPVTSSFTSGFGINNTNAAADVLGGEITLTRFAAGSNLWIASGQIYSVQGALQAISVQGEISLAGPLSGLRFNGNGATLTAGSVALAWRV